jgi:alanine racemase
MSALLAEKQHQYGIFEAGISQKGEMKKIEEILHPKYGIFTNIGDAHSSGFTDVYQKIEEKLKLFEKTQTLIYCKDHASLDKTIQSWAKNHKIQLVNWSMKSQADLAIYQIEEGRNGKKISAIFNHKVVTLELPFKDPTSIENAVQCWLMALLLGIPNEKIKRSASQLAHLDMRLYQTEGMGETQLIHDYYNSDLSSLEMAIDFLSRQQIKPKKTVILSDLEQNDLSPAKLYRKVARLLSVKKIDRVIGIGKHLFKMKFVFKTPEQDFFEDMPSFLEAFPNLKWHQESILIKGARSFRFEQ